MTLPTHPLQSLGVTQVPDSMVTGELREGSLIELLPACRPPAMPISIVMPSARLMPPRVRALIALLDTLLDTLHDRP